MKKVAVLALTALLALGLGAAVAAPMHRAAAGTVADGYGWGSVVLPTH
ncbi:MULTISPECIES: hypothetical protein [Kitasatospora]|nr:hypothetical protein [Kitasatospora sp. GP30]MDH6142984.1 hypothetical protein [Kitasatospora sp. GP30]